MIIRLAKKPDASGLRPLLVIMKHTTWRIPINALVLSSLIWVLIISTAIRMWVAA